MSIIYSLLTDIQISVVIEATLNQTALSGKIKIFI